MELPIKFPSDAEVIREEVQRFRALSPRDRLHDIHSLITTGRFLMRNSTKRSFVADYIEQQEEAARQAVREFISRHAS